MNHQLLKDLNEAFKQPNLMKQWLEECQKSMEPLYQAIQDERSQRLELICNHRPLTEIMIGPEFEQTLIEGLEPGNYQLQTASGWQIWEQPLTASHLVVRCDEPLPLAASSQDQLCEPSLQANILEGWLNLEIHPGLNHGSILVRK